MHPQIMQFGITFPGANIQLTGEPTFAVMQRELGAHYPYAGLGTARQ